MRTVSIYKLTISLERGIRWEQWFICRPNRDEIITAILVWHDKELSATSTETGQRMVKAKSDHLITLVRDHWNADDTLRVCTYAGETVGNIELKLQADALETVAVALEEADNA